MRAARMARATRPPAIPPTRAPVLSEAEDAAVELTVGVESAPVAENVGVLVNVSKLVLACTWPCTWP